MAWAAIDPEGPRHLAIGAAKSEGHLCKEIPGCNYRESDGIWRAPLSWGSYVAFKTVWSRQPVTESASLLDWAASAWQNVQIAYGLRSQVDAPDGVLREIGEVETAGMASSGKVLFPPQRGGVAWLVTQKRAVLGDPQGNGKTPQVIRALQLLKRRGEIGMASGRPALIICRGAMVYGWADELGDWAPELVVRVVSGTALKRRRALVGDGGELLPLADVYIIAWPNLRMHTRLAPYHGQAMVRCNEHGGTTGKSVSLCEVHEKELNLIPWGAVIPDEAHAMRDAKSKQSRAASYLMQRAAYAWPVTGTPVADHAGDFWPLGHAIDPASFPVRSRYLDLWTVKNMAWHGGTEILGLRPENELAFHSLIQPLIRRIPAEITRPFMPDRLPVQFRYPEMEPKQATAYKQLRKEMLADLAPGSTEVPANDGVRFGRLCQLASSMLAHTDTEDRWAGYTTTAVDLIFPSNKVADLTEFLDDNPGPLVVAANSPRLIALAEKRLGELKITSTKIIGGLGDATKHERVRWFQEGQVRVIFLTSGAGGEGITLTASNTVFFMQPNPSYLATTQMIGRVDRIGQHRPVRVVYSISKGTVDERMYTLGTDKAERAGQVTQDPVLLHWIISGDEVASHTQLLLPEG
jgi:SNF2 family DNA or RNA helicase